MKILWLLLNIASRIFIPKWKILSLYTRGSVHEQMRQLNVVVLSFDNTKYATLLYYHNSHNGLDVPFLSVSSMYKFSTHAK